MAVKKQISKKEDRYSKQLLAEYHINQRLKYIKKANDNIKITVMINIGGDKYGEN